MSFPLGLQQQNHNNKPAVISAARPIKRGKRIGSKLVELDGLQQPREQQCWPSGQQMAELLVALGQHCCVAEAQQAEPAGELHEIVVLAG